MEFLREGASRSQHPDWCAYCGHPPTSHNEIEDLTDLMMVDHPAREEVTDEKDDSVEGWERRGRFYTPAQYGLHKKAAQVRQESAISRESDKHHATTHG